MTESEAIVIRVEGHYMWIDVDAGCANCDKSGGCGLGDGKGKAPQCLPNSIGAQVGDTVVVMAPDGAILRAVLHSYLVPLVMALFGAATGTAIGGELGAMAGAIAGLAVGWLWLLRTGGREPLLTIRLKDAVIHLHRNAQS
jgi:positive regulator of sigma E activity